MNYCGLEKCDTLNGSGFHVSIWVSGCNHTPKCPYCQNRNAWDFNYGKEFTQETIEEIVTAMDKPYINALSIIGGEPMDNLGDGSMFKLLETIKEKFHNDKKIWCWTGRIFDELATDNEKKFLSYIDVLIDGEYDYTKKNLNRAWANSTNQRVIDVKKTLEKGEVVLWDI